MAEVELMVKQDTGWRNVSNLRSPEFASAALLIRRVGALVQIQGELVPGTTLATKPLTNTVKIMDLPVGFQPRILSPNGQMLSLARLGTLASLADYAVLHCYSTSPGNWGTSTAYVNAMFMTSNPFPLPAAYPGTPA